MTGSRNAIVTDVNERGFALVGVVLLLMMSAAPPASPSADGATFGSPAKWMTHGRG